MGSGVKGVKIYRGVDYHMNRMIIYNLSSNGPTLNYLIDRVFVDATSEYEWNNYLTRMLGLDTDPAGKTDNVNN